MGSGSVSGNPWCFGQEGRDVGDWEEGPRGWLVTMAHMGDETIVLVTDRAGGERHRVP